MAFHLSLLALSVTTVLIFSPRLTKKCHSVSLSISRVNKKFKGILWGDYFVFLIFALAAPQESLLRQTLGPGVKHLFSNFFCF